MLLPQSARMALPEVAVPSVARPTAGPAPASAALAAPFAGHVAALYGALCAVITRHHRVRQSAAAWRGALTERKPIKGALDEEQERHLSPSQKKLTEKIAA